MNILMQALVEFKRKLFHQISNGNGIYNIGIKENYRQKISNITNLQRFRFLFPLINMYWTQCFYHIEMIEMSILMQYKLINSYDGGSRYIRFLISLGVSRSFQAATPDFFSSIFFRSWCLSICAAFSGTYQTTKRYLATV